MYIIGVYVENQDKTTKSVDELKHIVEIIKWGLRKDGTTLNTKDEQSTFKPLITWFKCKYMLYINT